ncbi:MAG TPA: YebC/PmpR family DNA-binding transcriptional regulator [Polyangiales bacterium]|nr:YebC/PmpR family DNA-binding transcriptional regulator [Polyangiales bacterium]
MSGHSKWSTIKRKKGALDAKRGAIFTKLIKEITVAARLGGGDPAANFRLRRALDEARLSNMPADNLTRAIKKGTGELEGVSYEELLYEGVGPSGTLILCEIMTDNRNRTAAELRKVFDKHDGVLGAAGSAAWAFDAKGLITLPESAASEEQLFEIAVGAGAEDVVSNGENWVITTPVDLLEAVREALTRAKIALRSASLAKIPKTPKVLGGADALTAVNLVETLEDHDDVQKVYTDFELSEEALQNLGQ